MLRGRVGIEYPKPLANLLQGERPSGSIAIELQRGEVANGITRERARRTSQPQTPDNTDLVSLAVA